MTILHREQTRSRQPPVRRADGDRPVSALWPAVAIVGLAAALRLRGLFTDFWFDEIWSYEEFARRATSIRDIFFGQAFKHDNNHLLNTLIMYLLRDRPGWTVYRWPAFLSGLVAVAVAVYIGRSRDRREGVLSGVLVAASFMMAVYFTEARGYGFVLLFSLLAFVALRRYLDSPSLQSAAGFWVWIALGLAAHPSIAHFYLGALLWSGYRLRGRLTDFAYLHAVPLLGAALWAALVLRGAVVGGGPPWTWRTIADESLAWTIGYPLSTVPAAAALAAAVLLVVWDAQRLWIERSDEGLFYVGAILGPPVLITALSPPYLFPRYFLVSLLFLLLVLARALARLLRQPTWGGPLTAALVILFVIGNLRHLVPFSEYGRGGASHAVETIVASTPKPEILVTSQSVDRWSQLPISFYERKLGLGNRIRYVSRKDLADHAALPEAIDWVIVQSQAPVPTPAPTISLPSGGPFELRARYPAYGPSGMSWFLYQRRDMRAGHATLSAVRR